MVRRGGLYPACEIEMAVVTRLRIVMHIGFKMELGMVIETYRCLVCG